MNDGQVVVLRIALRRKIEVVKRLFDIFFRDNGTEVHADQLIKRIAGQSLQIDVGRQIVAFQIHRVHGGRIIFEQGFVTLLALLEHRFEMLSLGDVPADGEKLLGAVLSDDVAAVRLKPDILPVLAAVPVSDGRVDAGVRSLLLSLLHPQQIIGMKVGVGVHPHHFLRLAAKQRPAGR
ncbi:hypothetical protein D3C71_1674500 [compost metagenome]